jgi:hypothetical protein
MAVGSAFFHDPGLSLLWEPSAAAFATDLRVQLLHFSAVAGCFGVVFLVMAWLTDAQEILQLVRSAGRG